MVCRHEQNAAFIAGGIGRMTGKPALRSSRRGRASPISSPGSRRPTPRATRSWRSAARVATAETLKQIHQTMDSVSLCKPVTKFSASVASPEAVAEVVSNAFRAAESGRPGAAFVSLPRDIMAAPRPGTPARPAVLFRPGPASGTAIAEAGRLISKAANPVVLLGLLASSPTHAAAIREFIEATRLAVVGTFQAAGAVGAHLMSSFGGRVGQLANQPADRLLEAADLIITIGYDSVEYDPSIWNKSNDRPVIHIDVIPADLDNCYAPAVELTGDIAQTLQVLTPLAGRAHKPALSESLLQDIEKQRRALNEDAAARSGRPIHPLRLAFELQEFLGPDVTMCLDMGSFHLWLARHVYSFRTRQVLISNGQQTLGVALPWAIAASLVRPAEKVLSISGDGGFLFSAMELETAVRLKCNIVHMIWIDGSYDMVGVQEVLKYGRKSGVDLGPYDPVKYAEAFGATGMTIEGPRGQRAFDTPGPVIIGVKVDYSDNHKLFEMVDPNGFH
ncbi:MAG: acetolactate synthase AlsS [Pararobbsia sp.]